MNCEVVLVFKHNSFGWFHNQESENEMTRWTFKNKVDTVGERGWPTKSNVKSISQRKRMGELQDWSVQGCMYREEQVEPLLPWPLLWGSSKKYVKKRKDKKREG